MLTELSYYYLEKFQESPEPLTLVFFWSFKVFIPLCRLALHLWCIQQPCSLLRWQREESPWLNSTWKTHQPPCTSSVFQLPSHVTSDTLLSLTCQYIMLMTHTTLILIPVSGSTFMAPVGPRYRLHWHAMRRSKVNDESWTSAARRTHCLLLGDYIDTNTKNNVVIKWVLNNEGTPMSTWKVNGGTVPQMQNKLIIYYQ